MAAVAVSSAAMAQVTISGNVDARYQSATTKVDTAVKGAKLNTAGAVVAFDAGTALATGETLLRAAVAAGESTTKGFLINDAQLHFTATEDLGGGTTATARFTIDGATSDGSSVTGDGVFLSLANASLGSVTFSSVDASDYLPMDLVTDTNLFNGTVDDRVTYSSPTMAGLRFTATMQEGNVGAGKSATNQSKIYEIDYAAGPLTLNAGMLSVDKNKHTAFDGGTRVRVGYNFGVAAVSYGMINTKDKDGVKDKTTGLSVTVPMGAITLGYAYGTHKDGAAAKIDGSAFSASYALSKRTSLHAEQVNYETATFSSAKRTRITARHSF